MQLPKNKFKAALQTGDVLPGLWSSLCSPMIAEVLGDSDFDWILLDTEHSPNETPTLVAQMQAMSAGHASAIVRPAWNDPVLIKRLLDIGAQTLLIPFVQNADEAKAAVAATRYPPQGIRGVAGSGRAARYGRVKNYLQTASDEIAVLVQIESVEALTHIEDIAQVDGVDGVFIGPGDLSASMGHLGHAEHPDVQAAIKSAIDTLNKLGKPGGILAFNPDVAKRYQAWGYRFVAVGSDLSLIVNGADTLCSKFR